MSTVVIAEEEVTNDLIIEMLPLLEEHRIEISAFKDMELNPNIKLYLELAKIKMYMVYVARDTGRIVGYAGYFINPNFHYQAYTYATQDVVYVEKSRRGVMLGSKLLNYADNELQKIGVDVVTHHVKVKQDFGELLKRNGYTWVEKIFMKRLQQ